MVVFFVGIRSTHREAEGETDERYSGAIDGDLNRWKVRTKSVRSVRSLTNSLQSL